MQGAEQSWRPWNESASDLEHESRAAATLERLWPITICKLSPRLYHVDWSLHGVGTKLLLAFAEYKFRQEQFDTVLLSFSKFEIGCRLAREARVRFFFFVEFASTERLHWVELTSMGCGGLRIEAGGNARGQNGDTEPVIHLPFADFHAVGIGR